MPFGIDKNVSLDEVPPYKTLMTMKQFRAFCDNQDLSRLIEWGKDYVESYHLEDQMEATVIIEGIYGEGKQFKHQVMAPDSREQIIELGKELVNQDKFPLLYCLAAEMGMISAEEVDGSLQPSGEVQEVYGVSLITSSLSAGDSVWVAEIIRDPYGNKYAVGDWRCLDGSAIVDNSMAAIWHGAADAAKEVLRGVLSNE